MMVDVDALTRRFGKLIATHCCIAHVLSERDKNLRPKAYIKSTFHSSATTKLETPTEPYKSRPVLYSRCVMDTIQGTPIVEVHTPSTIISLCPVLFIEASKETIIKENPNDTEMKITAVARTLFSKWWCIDDYSILLLHWSTIHPDESTRWEFKFMYTTTIGQHIFSILYDENLYILMDTRRYFLQLTYATYQF